MDSLSQPSSSLSPQVSTSDQRRSNGNINSHQSSPTLSHSSFLHASTSTSSSRTVPASALSDASSHSDETTAGDANSTTIPVGDDQPTLHGDASNGTIGQQSPPSTLPPASSVSQVEASKTAVDSLSTESVSHPAAPPSIGISHLFAPAGTSAAPGPSSSSSSSSSFRPNLYNPYLQSHPMSHQLPSFHGGHPHPFGSFGAVAHDGEEDDDIDATIADYHRRSLEWERERQHNRRRLRKRNRHVRGYGRGNYDRSSESTPNPYSRCFDPLLLLFPQTSTEWIEAGWRWMAKPLIASTLTVLTMLLADRAYHKLAQHFAPPTRVVAVTQFDPRAGEMTTVAIPTHQLQQ